LVPRAKVNESLKTVYFQEAEKAITIQFKTFELKKKITFECTILARTVEAIHFME
jgi:hypothetical protein